MAYLLKFPEMKDIHNLLAFKSVGKYMDPQIKLPYRVLVVENNIDIRRINAEVLERAGYHVDTAEDGEGGWNALLEAMNTPNHYHLLITDCNTPRLSGLDIIKKLRNAREELPVIVASASLSEHDFFSQTWLKPATLLLKPYTISELLDAAFEALDAAFRHTGQTAQLAQRQTQQFASL